MRTATKMGAHREERQPEKKKKERSEVVLPLPEGVSVIVEERYVRVRGKKGEAVRKLQSKEVSLQATADEVRLSAHASGKGKKLLGSVVAHLRNMLRGCSEGHVYRLKVCSGHFPMSAAVSGKEFVVKNLFGEKTPRTIPLRENVEVKVSGTEIVVTSADKEAAGQMAADIEQLTRRPGFDKRVFQDGIYITEKDSVVIK